MQVNIDTGRIITGIITAGILAGITTFIGFVGVKAKVDEHDSQLDVIVEVLCVLASKEMPEYSLKRCLEMDRGRGKK